MMSKMLSDQIFQRNSVRFDCVCLHAYAYVCAYAYMNVSDRQKCNAKLLTAFYQICDTQFICDVNQILFVVYDV